MNPLAHSLYPCYLACRHPFPPPPHTCRHIVWHGPVGDVVPFFTSLGFQCPPRKDVPSFLQEVVTESGADGVLRKNGVVGV